MQSGFAVPVVQVVPNSQLWRVLAEPLDEFDTEFISRD